MPLKFNLSALYLEISEPESQTWTLVLVRINLLALFPNNSAQPRQQCPGSALLFVERLCGAS
ncbi:hypothetical protein A6J40_07810 [Legionella longbeachae]|uniref:Uncharacterized protein n=1 Tax=Legionella longbeachae serogroup 1 (strain NSW150) TaxID=661367 RepID=D3HQ77_LEGLN|nr:hypothetical protein A6J40_07810 [Legionella longbeachae]CBJ11046.1 hypothetical protein LLO_0705 [Legionella longbeachae NSW150]